MSRRLPRRFGRALIAMLAAIALSVVPVAVEPVAAVVASPDVTPGAGTYEAPHVVTMSSRTFGADVYYTLDGTPITNTRNATLYAGPIELGPGEYDIVAVASDGFELSSPTTVDRITVEVAPPTITPGAGTYSEPHQVTLASATPGADIEYRLDGTTPAPGNPGVPYSGPFHLPAGVHHIVAVASVGSHTSFASFSGQIVVEAVNLPAPVIFPAEGSYDTKFTVLIDSTVIGGSIRYTLDGTAPKADSTEFTTPFLIETAGTTVVRARVFLAGVSPSPEASATFELEGCAGLTPTVWIANGDAPTEGNDIILGTSGADIIDGLGGDDIICGGDGGDDIQGGDGNDFVVGGDGDDDISGGNGIDYLDGGNGSDDLDGGADKDVLIGGPGNDTLLGQAGDDELYGFAGIDDMSGGSGNDYLWGGTGDDFVLGGDGDDFLDGHSDNDLLRGDAGNDILLGRDGDDTLLGGAGSDYLWGGDGEDDLRGGDDADYLDGNNTDGVGDTLDGGPGDDTVLGYEGDDTLEGGAGSDYLWGGPGVDSFSGGDDADYLDGDDEGEAMLGGAGPDVLLGFDGNDVLSGEAGDDYLWGGHGSDILEGGADTDTCQDPQNGTFGASCEYAGP